LVSAFAMVSTVWSVSCLLFFHSRCPPRAQPFVKVGARVPRHVWWTPIPSSFLFAIVSIHFDSHFPTNTNLMLVCSSALARDKLISQATLSIIITVITHKSSVYVTGLSAREGDESVSGHVAYAPRSLYVRDARTTSDLRLPSHEQIVKCILFCTGVLFQPQCNCLYSSAKLSFSAASAREYLSQTWRIY